MKLLGMEGGSAARLLTRVCRALTVNKGVVAAASEPGASLMGPNHVFRGRPLKQAGLISEILRGRRSMQNRGGRFRAVFRRQTCRRSSPRREKCTIVSPGRGSVRRQGDFVGVDQNKFSLDRSQLPVRERSEGRSSCRQSCSCVRGTDDRGSRAT